MHDKMHENHIKITARISRRENQLINHTITLSRRALEIPLEPPRTSTGGTLPHGPANV